MNIETINSILTIGETTAVEFKRCGNGIESDVYETVCSFLNRFGGDIFMGVLDDGTVAGVPEKAAIDMVKNFISVVSNPSLFSPTTYLVPEIIKYDEKRTIIYVHIPPSAEVHSYKKVIYDRVDDADAKVTATGAIAQMYIRKQNIFTEKKIYPYAEMGDLRLDLLPRVRMLARNNASNGKHSWATMSDEELLKSAGLYGYDIATGERGLNLAAIMLLGKDDVILNVAPAYVTDALVRKVNVDRYDDREIIKTNLIESYDLLLEFGRKHLPDNLEPNPKNPIIASFFRNIGYADQLGSGVRNLFKYTKFYSGKNPEFKEGDIFRIIVPLDDIYSYDFGPVDRIEETNDARSGSKHIEVIIENADKVPTSADKTSISADKVLTSADKTPISADKVPIRRRREKLEIQEGLVVEYVKKKGTITSGETAKILGVQQRRARNILNELAKKEILVKKGSYKSTSYVLKKER